MARPANRMSDDRSAGPPICPPTDKFTRPAQQTRLPARLLGNRRIRTPTSMVIDFEGKGKFCQEGLSKPKPGNMLSGGVLPGRFCRRGSVREGVFPEGGVRPPKWCWTLSAFDSLPIGAMIVAFDCKLLDKKARIFLQHPVSTLELRKFDVDS